MVDQPPAVTTQHSFDPNDALQAGGFVERRLHPSDRRATLVTLTELGTRRPKYDPHLDPKRSVRSPCTPTTPRAFMNEVRRHL